MRQARAVVDHGDRHDRYQAQQENYRKTELGIVQHSGAQFKFGCDVTVSHVS